MNRGREESVGNDDVSFVCVRKYEMVRMTQRQKIPKVDFVTFIVQSFFDTLLRYAEAFCGEVVLKVMDQKTLVKRRGGYKVRLTVYI